MAQNPLAASIFARLWGSTVQTPLSIGKQSDLRVSQAHGMRYNAAYNGALFFGANQAGVTSSAGLATTCVGLILSNPAGSGVNLTMHRVAGALIVAPAAVTGFNLIYGYAAGGITVHTTALTPSPALIGSGIAPLGKLDQAATLVGSPAYAMPLSETQGATALPAFSFDFEGGFMIAPGGYVAVGTTIASPASGFMAGISWGEYPV